MILEALLMSGNVNFSERALCIWQYVKSGAVDEPSFFAKSGSPSTTDDSRKWRHY
jgi:hypothetical protein